MLHQRLLSILFLSLLFFHEPLLHAKLPDLTQKKVLTKVQEIMKSHATYKKMTPELIKRTLQNYLEELDPTKSYFIESDIHPWIDPSPEALERILKEFNNGNFTEFKKIHKVMGTAIYRRHQLEKEIHLADFPPHVNPEEFKEMKWVKDDQELTTRLTRIKALQLEASAKMSDELKEKALQRIAKRQTKFEESILTSDETQKEALILSNLLKATASALDAHSSYFTPDEAAQFMINVQQRLFGIGAQLRDDINGFAVIKIIEGGPAAEGKLLKVNDRIIAVNGEPVVGMDIIDAVELIRGEEHTPVTLTVIRQIPDTSATLNSEEKPKTHEEKLDITVKRGEVVLKETRYEIAYEPFGDGVIAYLRLYSFYQDPESSSGGDLEKALRKLKEEQKVKGVILDLRFNSGGMLSQAVAVTGLFITKGIVVSIKDNTGSVQHLRDLNPKTAWDGPLIVLINRASASASEIVAQTLQDYGRALILGDDHSYGKGTFQTFTLNTTGHINPEGEYKVTRGKYYTVSGKTPQQTGVFSEIVIPGSLSETEIGEKFSKYALENDMIKENFDDDLSDIPLSQREKIRKLYKFDLQPKMTTYAKYLEKLKTNSLYRIENNKNYQNFLKEIKKKDTLLNEESEDQFGQNDLQLTEAYNVMKDLIILMK